MPTHQEEIQRLENHLDGPSRAFVRGCVSLTIEQGPRPGAFISNPQLFFLDLHWLEDDEGEAPKSREELHVQALTVYAQAMTENKEFWRLVRVYKKNKVRGLDASSDAVALADLLLRVGGVENV